MHKGWAQNCKVSLVGAMGFTVTGSTLDEWLRLGIAFATLIYMGFNAASAARKYFKNDDSKMD